MDNNIREIIFYDVYTNRFVARWDVETKDGFKYYVGAVPISRGISHEDFHNRIRLPHIASLKSSLRDKGVPLSRLIPLEIPKIPDEMKHLSCKSLNT